MLYKCMKFHQNILNCYQVIDFVKDRQTERQIDRREGKNNMSPDPEGGRRT